MLKLSINTQKNSIIINSLLYLQRSISHSTNVDSMVRNKFQLLEKGTMHHLPTLVQRSHAILVY